MSKYVWYDYTFHDSFEWLQYSRSGSVVPICLPLHSFPVMHRSFLISVEDEPQESRFRLCPFKPYRRKKNKTKVKGSV